VPVEVVRLEVEQHRHVQGELVTSSRWNDDTSQTTHSAESIEESGVPMFPATATSFPAARKIAPSSSTVVDLPFVPVTPTNRLPPGASSRHPSSSSDHTGIPRRRASSASGRSPGTPGDLTTNSTPSSSERSSSFPSDRSTLRTSSPRSSRAAAAASPERAKP
jgi:hypothetical protein